VWLDPEECTVAGDEDGCIRRAQKGGILETFGALSLYLGQLDSKKRKRSS
jgi:hypothetical protein